MALGIGGIIGGGVFAALGVAARLSGHAAFLTYLFAGVIALASGYSYIHMTRRYQEEGGSFTYLEHYVKNIKIAAVIGWILIVGYIGTMAMYSYAFGSFAAGMVGLSGTSWLRRMLSVGVIGVFLLVNYWGVRETGRSEEFLVYGKVAILLGFVFLGMWGIAVRPDFHFLSGGVFTKGVIAPLIGMGVIFVSFEGFQLLTYEYTTISGGLHTLKKAILISIILSTTIYVLVALVTTSLVTPQQIVEHEETILAFAASKMFAHPLFNRLSYILVAIAALFSTASAINATLFGTARLGYRVAKEKGLPTLFSFRNKRDIPVHSLLMVGSLTAVFTFVGTLEVITTFASVSFLIVFSVVNFLCLIDQEVTPRRLVPGFGLAGSVTALCILLWNLATTTLLFIGGVFALVVLLELLFVERKDIGSAVHHTRKR